MHVGASAGLRPTCMAAQRASLGMVLIKPNSARRRKRRPGANRSTFIFTDTAKLSEREGGRGTLLTMHLMMETNALLCQKQSESNT